VGGVGGGGGGDVGVGTLQSQATSKFAEHSMVLRITEVFDKVIMSSQQLLDSQNGGNSIKVVGRQDRTADAYEFFSKMHEQGCRSGIGVGKGGPSPWNLAMSTLCL
jgi:pentatricopeptide repeat protein